MDTLDDDSKWYRLWATTGTSAQVVVVVGLVVVK